MYSKIRNNFLAFSVAFLLLIVNQQRVESACDTILACQNEGKFNTDTCRCDCFATYNGATCEQLVCTVNDPLDCSKIPSSYCTLSRINAYCPHMCGKCPIPTTLPPTTLPPTTKPSCVQTAMCENSGSFNNATCRCNCFKSYIGTFCETLDCSVAEPTNCASLTQSQCSVRVINDYCPKLCGRCAPKPVIPNCPNVLECKNGARFSNTSCKCECFPSYKGESCESLDCSLSDPSSCSSFAPNQCSVALVYSYCPKLCSRCSIIFTTSTSPVTTTSGSSTDTTTSGSSPATTTSGSSTDTTTSGSSPATTTSGASTDTTTSGSSPATTTSGASTDTTTKCPTPVCKNGGSVNSVDPCKCDCLPNYADGKDCSTKSCSSEPLACNGITDPESECNIYPFDLLCPLTCSTC